MSSLRFTSSFSGPRHLASAICRAPLPASTSFEVESEDSDVARELAIALAKVAWDTKGEDIIVLDVAEQASWCRYMVMVTIFSRPQLNAIIGKLEKEARQVWGRQVYSNQGRSAWEVLDVGDVVVHVFGAELREYYDLESFYSTSEEVELPFITSEARQDDIEWQTSQRI